MKWLLLLLISINVVLFLVQIKEHNSPNSVSGFVKENGAQDLKLLKDLKRDKPGRCVVVGALADKNASDAVVSLLNEKNIKYEFVEKENELAPSYWVYVVDDVNESIIERLSAGGVESYLIATGDLRGRLSAGLFANIDLARDMIKELKDMGVDAAYVEKVKVKKTLWISFALAKVESGELIIEALKGLDVNLGEIKEFFCKSIASEK